MSFKAEKSSGRDPRSPSSNRYGSHRGSGGPCGENVIPSVADVGLFRKDTSLAPPTVVPSRNEAREGREKS
jgi:hypothetical protein